MRFSRQEYWSGLPCPSPGDLPDPGIEPTPLTSPALAGRYFTPSATWEAQIMVLWDSKFPQSDENEIIISNFYFELLWLLVRLNIFVTSISYLSLGFCEIIYFSHFLVAICQLLTSVSGEGNGTPLQYSRLENPMGGGALWAAVHGVAKSRTRLSDFTSTFHFHALEKDMATHSSVLAWRIPGTGEPGGLPSMGSHRVGHDWSDLAVVAVSSSSGSLFNSWYWPLLPCKYLLPNCSLLLIHLVHYGRKVNNLNP